MRMVIKRIGIMALGLGITLGCGDTNKKQTVRETVEEAGDQSDSSQAAAEKAEEPKSQTPVEQKTTPPPSQPSSQNSTPVVVESKCQPPAGDIANPQTIDGFVKFVNALPKPVTIRCVLQAMPRPLKVHATSSDLSVQPAVDADNPRIFILQGNDLILSFVPTGAGSKAIELSQLVSNSASVKAEIGFPVAADVAPAEPYKRILAASGTGSKCVGCHFNEKQTLSTFPPEAYTSKAIKPYPSQKVSAIELWNIRKKCASQATERCDILRALYGDSSAGIEIVDFPDSMPTLTQF